MVPAERILLGFDARVEPSTMRDSWSTSERRTGLVRVDVAIPLSVDYLVWPSIWPLEGTGWRGPIQDLWDTPRRLSSALRARPMRQPFWRIAVALVPQGLDAREVEAWTARARPVSLKAVSSRWRSLGFDVADRYLTSGLVRFHDEDALVGLRRTWVRFINENHLFVDPTCARDFAMQCDQHPDHAPFFVYEIFLLAQS